MIDALYAASSGMAAQEASINVIAGNLSNVNTPAFKKGRVEFREFIAQTEMATRSADTTVAGGVAVAEVGSVFTAGEIKQTGRALDLAIQGDAFFEIVLPDGSLGYTRAGAFRVDAEGSLVTQDGYPLSSMVQLPNEPAEFIVNPDGTGLLKQAQGETTEVGSVELVRFVNPEGLTNLGGGIFAASEISGQPERVRAGEQGGNFMLQGYLELSNVNMVDELSELMLAQRAMEVNSRVVQVTHEILGLINDLRK